MDPEEFSREGIKNLRAVPNVPPFDEHTDYNQAAYVVFSSRYKADGCVLLPELVPKA